MLSLGLAIQFEWEEFVVMLAGLVSGLFSGLVRSHPQGYSPCAMEKKGSYVAGGDEF